MNTGAFLLRVAICFALSLIPVADIDNLIYSTRLELRGKWTDAASFLIIDPAGEGQSPAALRWRLLAQGATTVVRASDSGPAELLLDPDGVVRRATLLHHQTRSQTYSAYLALKLDPARLKHPERPHLINFAGPPGSISRCTAGACGKIQGRTIVLNDTDDTLRTPLGEMTRAEVLANELNTIVGRHPIYRATWIERSILTLLIILFTAFCIIYYPVLLSAIAVAGAGAALVILVFQVVFQLFDIYIPSANLSGAFLIAYLIFTGYRLAFQENLQWRSLKQAQYLRELDQMKSNFLSLVSHDLKTPLAKIQAGVDRLRREIQAPEELSELTEIVESIEGSNNELKRYISSVLSLSKIESQKVILNKKSHDINRVIQESLKRLRPVALQKKIRIEESLEPLFSIECDENLMQQVVSNLIDNAIKYSPPHSKVIVRSQEEDGFVRVEVEDFGPGIPRSQLPLMFRKFNRFLRPMHEQVKGTGLGLYLSKYFIELHGGTIGLKSVEGQGTVFTFKLPLGTPAPSSVKLKTAPKSTMLAPPYA